MEQKSDIPGYSDVERAQKNGGALRGVSKRLRLPKGVHDGFFPVNKKKHPLFVKG